MYSALDTDGNRVGKPLKSSLFGKSYGVEALEQTMKKSGEEIKADKQAAKTKALVSASLNGSRTGSKFRADLQGKSIDLVLRYGNGGRLFGVTFINHNSRTVLNGSALRKEFSANAPGARFTDFATASREDLQPVSSAPAKEALRSLQEDKQPAIVKGYSGDDSPVGNLLSVLTPEPDQYNDNEPIPKKKRKKNGGMGGRYKNFTSYNSFY